MRRRFLKGALALLGGAAFALGAQAQGYPERPVRLVVGFPPGGSSDTVARVVAHHLAPLLGQPVVVENRPGAGGVIGSEAVAKAAPDGHTLLLATAGHSTAAAMMQKLPFDALKDFAWVSTITTYPFAIATAADSRIRSFEDLIARAKAAPGKISYSSAGVGTSHHLLGEWLSAEAGIEMIHVPFKGGTSPLTEVLAGRVDVMIETMTLVLPHIQSGKLRGLAVTSPEPKDYLPGVPPVAKTFPNIVFQSWLGIAAPAGTPAPIVQRLNAELRKVLAVPEVQQRLAALGGGAAPATPEQMRTQVATEIERWRLLVQTRRLERQ
ncbi:MAG TPA: tripartite tricarboxylate transporter substrate binding protein [Burkholderiales bacterium]|nr:tripartite tricarboxylate transporter substrate binding protein [Burkholderiales bacterium]